MNLSYSAIVGHFTNRRVLSLLGVSSLLGALLISAPAAQAQATYPLSDIFSNKGVAGLSSVQADAQQQKTTAPTYKSNGLETREYSGYFQADSSSTKLALLTDDGSSVWIDGNSVLNRAGQGQGFDIASNTTFHTLSYGFQAGRIYTIRVRYTNTAHFSDADVDGLTLFAYDGGGTVNPNKLWDVATSISGGRIKAPQDQTSTPATPSIVSVASGGIVPCEVEAATDLDHWTKGATQDTESDSVNYSWTASGGSMAPNDSEPRKANWTAPATPGDYELKCTINDGGTIGAGEFGTRDDSPIVKTVTVKVVPSASSVQLKLYRDAAFSQPLSSSDAVGGTVYVSLELTVGAGQTLTSSTGTVRVREEHALDEVHCETPNPSNGNKMNHLDLTYQLAPSEGGISGWKKKAGENGSWQDTSEWPTTKNTTLEPVYYRRAIAWQTTTHPLGHNEIHSVKIAAVDGNATTTSLAFTGSGTANGDAGTLSANVQNLVITDVSTNTNEDYFVCVPGDILERAQPKINFTIKDNGDAHKYKWTVNIRPTYMPYDPELTDAQPYATITGFAQQPGPVVTTWSGIMDSAGGLTGEGTYAFSIEVDEVTDAAATTALDSTSLRKPYSLKMVSHYAQLNDNLEPAVLEVGYRLTDGKGKNASSVRVDVLSNITYEKIGSKDLPKESGVEQGPIQVPIPTASEEARFVFVAEDSHGAAQRDHKNRRIVAVNQLAATRNLMIYLDKMTVGPGRVNELYIASALLRTQVIAGFTSNFNLDWDTKDPVPPNTLPSAPGGLPNPGYSHGLNNGYSRGVLVFEQDKMVFENEAGYTVLGFTNNCKLRRFVVDRKGNDLPGKLSYSSDAISAWSEHQEEPVIKWITSNTIIHELGHALGDYNGPGYGTSDNHCEMTVPTCIMYEKITRPYEGNMGPNWWTGVGSGHEKMHLNRIRNRMGIPER